MKSFKDNIGREWQLSININTIRKIKEKFKIDVSLFLRIDQEGLNVAELQKLDDPLLLTDLLFFICEKQAESQGITAESFADAISGNAIESATWAFLEAVAEFWPLSKRNAMMKLLEVSRKQQGELLAQLEKVLNDGTVEKLMLTVFEKGSSEGKEG